jgi:insertion element IS1 protein InsB
VAFYTGEKNKLWVIKALDRRTRRTVAWVLGNRDTATFRRLYDKVKHIKDCIFYTDNWSAFAQVLPPERHVVGKVHTVAIERDNSNTRHHLGRFTRRTKIVSKKVAMVDLTLKLWQVLTLEPWFEKYQAIALSIYK